MCEINRKARLIVRNVSFKATESDLNDLFSAYGVVQSVDFLKKDDKFTGCVFVQFERKQMAAKALHYLNLSDFLGRQIVVDWAVSKKVYDRVQKKKLKKLEIFKKKQAEQMMDESETAEVKLSDNDDTEIKTETVTESKDGGDNGDCDDDNDNDDKSKIKIEAKPKVKNLDDAQEGKTVFVKNIPFSTNKNDLKEFFKQFGPVIYSIICIDPLTEHSKGSGFVKFYKQEDAEKCLNHAEPLIFEDNQLYCLKAKNRNEIKPIQPKEKKDSRNLYLLKEGVIMAGSEAAKNVSVSDMKKRIELERRKNASIKNVIKFVSDRRLVIHNLPPDLSDKKLKKICINHSDKNVHVTECKIMRNFNKLESNGVCKSKGFAFVTFSDHQSALTALRAINNNPSIFTVNQRPIVSFSIEDKRILNIKQARQAASKSKNPLSNDSLHQNECDNSNIETGETSDYVDNDNNCEDNNNSSYQGFKSDTKLNTCRTNRKLKDQANLHLKLSKVERKKQLKRTELKKSNQKKHRKALERQLTKSVKLAKQDREAAKKKVTKSKKSGHDSNLLSKFERFIFSKTGGSDN